MTKDFRGILSREDVRLQRLLFTPEYDLNLLHRKCFRTLFQIKKKRSSFFSIEVLSCETIFSYVESIRWMDVVHFACVCTRRRSHDRHTYNFFNAELLERKHKKNAEVAGLQAKVTDK